MNTPSLPRVLRGNVLWGVVALTAVVVVALFLLMRNDERRIRRAFREAVQVLEKDGPENPIVAARRAERATEILTDDPSIELFEMHGRFTSRSEARSSVFHARASAEQLSVRLHDVSVAVDDSRQQAVLTGTAVVRGRSVHDRSGGREVVEFATEWIKTTDGWRMAVVRGVEAIRVIQ